MKKILIIAIGGTIASSKSDYIRLDKPLKILEYVEYGDIEFDCITPFSVLSENMSVDLWQRLIDCILNAQLEKYIGVIILHGSDTLAYTGALLANIFYDKKIILVAGDKPVEDEASNAVPNFHQAVEFLCNDIKGVFISYNNLYTACKTLSAGENDEFASIFAEHKAVANPVLKKKNILVIKPYVGICYDNYKLDDVDIVLHTMYHSATAPETVLPFISECKRRGVEFYFVTSKSKAEYESAKDFENIIFNSTVENAYASLLLS